MKTRKTWTIKIKLDNSSLLISRSICVDADVAKIKSQAKRKYSKFTFNINYFGTWWFGFLLVVCVGRLSNGKPGMQKE